MQLRRPRPRRNQPRQLDGPHLIFLQIVNAHPQIYVSHGQLHRFVDGQSVTQHGLVQAATVAIRTPAGCNAFVR